MVWAGAGLLALGVYVLWRAHRNRRSAIDVEYLLVDGALTPPRVTLAKFTGFGAFLVSTWIVLYLTVTGKFDSTAFVAYLAAWGAVKVAGDYITARTSPYQSSVRPDFVDDR